MAEIALEWTPVGESNLTATPQPNGSVRLPAASPAGSRKYGILVADDDPGVRDMLAFGMRHSGFHVLSAADGHLALELYRDHRESIDAALLDVRMPGLDGPQTFTKLRRLSPWLPCCFMSGDMGTYDEKMLRDLGAAAIFLKPFQVMEVAQTMLKLLTREPYRRIPISPQDQRTISRVALLGLQEVTQ